MLRLRKVLDAKGISTKACASVVRVSEKAMYNKIVGASEFTYSEASRLREILPEYNLDFLLSEEATPPAESAPPPA